MKILKSIATNIITGFLGAGKTSAIVHWLKQKPEHETWAILVNEFGELGIDGALLSALNESQQQVYIAQVPGGCMCCASKVPMQIALNQLLKQSRPDRLLIEPSGLGHPKTIKQLLTSTEYQSVLKLGPTLALVDARVIKDTKYTSHETFNQQLQIADIIVANKHDLYQVGDLQRLHTFVEQQQLSKVAFITASHGKIESHWLDSPTAPNSPTPRLIGSNQNSTMPQATPFSPPQLSNEKFTLWLNQADGFHSIGWQFSPALKFKHLKLLETFEQLNTIRIKALLNTDIGLTCYNQSTDIVSYQVTPSGEHNQLEIIAESIEQSRWTDAILQCLDE